MRVLITGACGGLGRVFVNECLKRGYSVCAVDINESGLISLVEGTSYRYNQSILYYSCDLTDEKSIDNLIDYLNSNKFHVDMLLNVAGVDYEGGFIEREYNQVKKIIDLNILGTLCISHKILLNRYNKNKKFFLVFVSSLAAEQPIPLKSAYAASKKFLLDFSTAISQELLIENVNVLSVCPGGLVTNDQVLKAIQGQGFFGHLTTCKMEIVVAQTLNKVIRGKTNKYIPGVFNHFLKVLNHLVPINIKMKILYKRWKKAQSTWLKTK